MKKDTRQSPLASRRVTGKHKVLPKTPRPMPDELAALAGSVCAQRVRCGRANCRCKSGGDALHGPYFYHFRREGGRLRKRYLRPDEVEATRAACARGRARRETTASYRKMQRMALPREYRDLLRDVQAMIGSAKHGG
jgi:hypothetical protein